MKAGRWGATTAHDTGMDWNILGGHGFQAARIWTSPSTNFATRQAYAWIQQQTFVHILMTIATEGQFHVSFYDRHGSAHMIMEKPEAKDGTTIPGRLEDVRNNPPWFDDKLAHIVLPSRALA